MSNEVKLRKKTQSAKSNNLSESPKAKGKDEVEKERLAPGSRVEKRSDSSLDLKTALCFLTLAVCGALAWVVIQQNERFSELENKYNLLHEKTAGLFTIEEEVLKVSEKCQGVQRAVEALGPGSLRPQLEALRRDAGQLSAWAAGSTEKRQQLRRSVAALTEAVARIEERTGAITTDVTNKVASVKTDVRRMEGLRSELESLLAQVGGLEEQALQAERTMVKRIADLLTASIDRVSALRAAAEENARAIDRLQRRIPDLAAADRQMSERLRELEGGRARLVRTVTFAADLKPKVASIKRDFAAFEPRLSDLTLRIGQLAEDLAHREQEVAELRGALAALAPLTPLDPGEQGGELAHGEQEVAELRGALAPGLQGELDSGEVTDVDDIGLRLQGLVSNALRQA
ncbi:unnamed protein product [Lota lota]